MKIHIEGHVRPEHIAAILSKLCGKYDLEMDGVDMFVNFRRRGENVDPYAEGSQDKAVLNFTDIYDKQPNRLSLPCPFEFLTEAEADTRKEAFVKEKAQRKVASDAYWEKYRLEQKKGYIGVVQRDNLFRFLVRISPLQMKFCCAKNEALLFAYYVSDRNKEKKALCEKYRGKIAEGKGYAALFNLSESDVLEIDEYLKNIAIDPPVRKNSE